MQGVKQHLRLRDDEIRVIVASISWKELLLPFSYLADLLPSELTGFHVEVDNAGNVEAMRRVQPIKVLADRLIAPWHNLYFYEDLRSTNLGKTSIEKVMKDRGVKDYIVVELKPREEFPDGLESQKQKAMREVLSQIAIAQGLEARDIPNPRYQHAFLVALQQLSTEGYLSILKESPSFSSEDMELLEEEIAECDEEGKAGVLHERLDGLEPYPTSDFVEIAYPAKFRERMREGWKVSTIHRYGAFYGNEFLHDDAIQEELLGSQGATGQTYRRSVDLSNRSQVGEVKEGVRKTLSDNAPWRTQIIRIIEEVEADRWDKVARIAVFNPSCGFLSIYKSFSERDLESWLPSYILTIPENEPSLVYFGSLEFDGSTVDYDEAVNELFEGKIFNSLILLMHGGYTENDVAIMEFLGLRYRSYKMEIDHGDKTYFKMTDGGWKQVEPFHPLQGVAQFFYANP